MAKEDITIPRKYFAAANGYGGFRSYFGEIFRSEDYERIYVLKGGPGTGKSSMMRRLSEDLSSLGGSIEEIYCSSDPHSLDGVTCKVGEKKIAMLDGTAPHERDAVIPGAIDCIINLGEGWDEKWLSVKRDKILALNLQKKKAYKTAYSYLSLCGASAKLESQVKYKEKIKEFAITSIKSLAELDLKQNNGKIETRLISSFGRYGRYTLTTLSEISDKIYSPNLNEYFNQVFMNELYAYLCYNNADFIHFPDPLDQYSTEAIHLPNSRITFALRGGEPTGESIADSKDAVESEREKVAKACYDRSLEEAERWFSIASDNHFLLEEIYKEAMDFDKNDRIYKEKYQEIINVLS